MTKIAFIMNSLYACGGEERVVSLIANELVKEHEVTIYTYEVRTALGETKNDYFLDERINVCILNQYNDNLVQKILKLLYAYTGLTGGNLSQILLQYAFYPRKFLDEWIDRLYKEKHDIIIGVSGVYSILLGLIRNEISSRCIAWEHSSYEGYFDPKRGYYRKRINTYVKSVKRLDTVVVLNNDIANKYKNILGLDTVVIPNPKSFESIEKANMNNKCFVTCGRLEAEKGYDDLINCFNQVSKELDDWKLIIIGGGSLKKALDLEANKLGIKDKVLITGYTHNVKKYLLEGSIFVMTSRWEGFPMCITEALELGLPVIAYGIPAMEPLVSDGIEGIIVPPFDSQKMIDSMKMIGKDSLKREQLSGKAIKKAEELTPRNIIKKWNELLWS